MNKELCIVPRSNGLHISSYRGDLEELSFFGDKYIYHSNDPINPIDDIYDYDIKVDPSSGKVIGIMYSIDSSSIIQNKNAWDNCPNIDIQECELSFNFVSCENYKEVSYQGLGTMLWRQVNGSYHMITIHDFDFIADIGKHIPEYPDVIMVS